MESLPDRAMVVVVGGGVAAMRLAEGLARSGADVVALAPEPYLGDLFDGRDLGLITPGLAEHPHRLVAAIGEDGARDLHSWTRASATGLGSLVRPVPMLRASAGEGEDPDIDADLSVLALLGFPADALNPESVRPRLGTDAFGQGHCTPGWGLVSPGDALATMYASATSAGARVYTDARALSFHDELADVCVVTTRGAVKADVVILAGDWRMRDLDPWCADKVVPVRRHFARYAPPPDGAPSPVALSAQHGWLRARIDPDGSLIVSGARWASPHFEMGETEMSVQPGILDALDRLVAQRFPRWHAAGRTHAWVGIAAHTCDQLPIVGPLPGRSSIIACFGWNGRPWAMATRAADAVVAGLSEPDVRPVTPWLRARRFV